jgi:CheY-like chemotaxis protein
MDGGEAVRRLGADERTRGIPVLMISAYADRVPRDLRLGCAAFLAKPCDIDELSGLLHLIVSVRSRRA